MTTTPLHPCDDGLSLPTLPNWRHPHIAALHAIRDVMAEVGTNPRLQPEYAALRASYLTLLPLGDGSTIEAERDGWRARCEASEAELDRAHSQLGGIRAVLDVDPDRLRDALSLVEHYAVEDYRRSREREAIIAALAATPSPTPEAPADAR